MIGKTLATLLSVGGLVGVYFIYQDFWRHEYQLRNPWVQRLTPLIRPHTARHVDTAQADGASEAGFLMMIFMAWRAAEDGYNMSETVENAATAAGAKESEARRIANVIAENVKLARSMDVFSNPSDVMSMERGEPPLVRAKGWEDERLVMGHVLSPALAPEAAFAIPNLRLMPESVRDMQTDHVTGHVRDLARKWLAEGLLYPASVAEIDKRLKDPTRYR